MSPRTVRVLLGVALAAAGVALVFSPNAVASALHRPAATLPQRINLRATWGGAVLGLGAFVAWLPALRPYKRAAAGMLLWSMAGIAAARATGFALDGGPDRLQWFWLGAEVVLALAGALALRSMRASRGAQNAQP